ncbi:D-hexose-6-phosphate mutarotase [Dechloromonas sp. HYN0024]|uniref:D-hexose-6-phosphate mutarotase n=1 Tax=Dechloromonas sp. HYN0024 TaxID=2231055 RepID=UPI000E445BF7|nr:D-hexose-6-phosphate mutarotase [Dechloromonas sp. HYN0024]AXS79654.1 D-hexose-6-phosphate mutarotase [Dechloromonas sp. HYN0024]
MKPSIESIDFHGIEALRLIGPRGATAIISKLGAQVLSWVPPDGKERLFLSDNAVFDGSVAIRGGIPVCFPQFGQLGDLPRHGLVRTCQWSVNSQRAGDDFALVTMETSSDEATLTLWPHAFHAELALMVEADRIDMELCITNTGGSPLSFTGALHTYLRVPQVEEAVLEGLHGLEYRDALDDNRVVREAHEELTIDREVDRVYLNAKRPQLLHAGKQSLAMQNQGFPDVVVWNPFVDRCAEMKDMPANGWRHMLCVEAAATRPITLPAGEEWYGRQTLVVV